MMDRGTIWRVWLPLVAGLWGLGWIFQSAPGPHGLARWIGLLLGLIGLAGVILSRYTLGRSFSVAPKATALVTSGIYSRIRNPIYISGEVFLTLGYTIRATPRVIANIRRIEAPRSIRGSRLSCHIKAEIAIITFTNAAADPIEGA